jgi:hypothetical protein
MMGLFEFFKRKKRKVNKVENFQPLMDVISKKKKKTYEEPTEYRYKRTDGEYIFKLGDKLICRSNEPDPLLVGELVSLWDNEGKWPDPIPYVKDEEGEIWGVMGIIRPYSDELYNELSKLKPLEQWNYFVTDKYKYNEEVMEQKEDFYKKRKKSLDRLPKK